MRINPVTVAWIIFGIIVIRMAWRMADGGARPADFLIMGGAGIAIAILIMLAGRLYQRRVRRTDL